MNSFEGKPLIITEARYQELVAKEKRLAEVLAANPELAKEKKVTPTLKRYKKAFSTFVGRVETVLSSNEIQSVFTMAHLHGVEYHGPFLAQDILDAKKLLGE